MNPWLAESPAATWNRADLSAVARSAKVDGRPLPSPPFFVAGATSRDSRGYFFSSVVQLTTTSRGAPSSLPALARIRKRLPSDATCQRWLSLV